MKLIEGDCLKELPNLPDKSIDFFFLDLPYGQTACKWDKKIDLDALWVQLKRLAKNDRTPFFFSTTTKFGFELYQHAPKGWFRWDLVWKKNKKTGFLNSYKLPMRQHEMIYCFAKKTPEYDTSSHKEFTYGESKNPGEREDNHYGLTSNKCGKRHKERLPGSDITQPSDDHELLYCFAKKTPEYDTSSHKDFELNHRPTDGKKTEGHYGLTNVEGKGKKHNDPLPTSAIISSWCEIKNDEKTGHRTAKPVKLMEFLLKYWTKEGDVVCDPTAGSGSMGVACKNMKREFIGIEKDPNIFNLMRVRLDKLDKKNCKI